MESARGSGAIFGGIRAQMMLFSPKNIERYGLKGDNYLAAQITKLNDGDKGPRRFYQHTVVDLEARDRRDVPDANGVWPMSSSHRTAILMPVEAPEYTDEEIIVKVGELCTAGVALRVASAGPGEDGAKMVAKALGREDDQAVRKIRKRMQNLLKDRRLIEGTRPGKNGKPSAAIFEVEPGVLKAAKAAVAELEREDPLGD
jgi:hypothetical protein